MTREDILNAIPHRPPFLFIDEIGQWDENRIVCHYTFKKDEFFFAGHYPGSPIVPGVILCESAMQAGAILMSKRLRAGEDTANMVPVVARMNDIRFKQTVFPGDTITIDVTFTERLGNAWFMAAKLLCKDKIAVRFDFSCTVTERPATISK